MTRIYEEAQIDVPKIGNGQEIYNFILQKSRTGKEFIAAAKKDDKAQMCVLAADLSLMGYSREELKSFFEFVFSDT